MTRLVAGCMTGTSIDAIDAALVEIEGEGLAMSARFVRGVARPLGRLAPLLQRIADQERMAAGDIARIARDFAVLHAEVVREVAGDARLDLVCVHGQTVYHAPPLSWQLFSPAPLVRAIQAPLVFDLRAADLAAGGEGAPITPLADWVLFRNAGVVLAGAPSAVAVVNLGGFVNITLLPPDEGQNGTGIDRIDGGDVCVCNQLLDRIARELFDMAYDAGGGVAGSGQIHAEARADLRDMLAEQALRGRSLGTGDEAAAWLTRWRTTARPQDLARTACEAIAQTVAERVKGSVVLLAGGGVHNRTLAEALESCCDGGIRSTRDVGIPPSYREAACFAVLAALCQDKVPITLSKITGLDSHAPLAGCWMYP